MRCNIAIAATVGNGVKIVRTRRSTFDPQVALPQAKARVAHLTTGTTLCTVRRADREAQTMTEESGVAGLEKSLDELEALLKNWRAAS